VKNIVLKILLVAWVIIWAIFLIRPLIKKDLIKDYSNLSKLSTEGKRAYVTGPKLYEFIAACDRSISKPSSYEVVGIEKDSLEHRRMRYYLYPNIEKNDPEYILVYATKNYERLDYNKFITLDPDSYILRKIN
jgi:hypothetical protein